MTSMYAPLLCPTARWCWNLSYCRRSLGAAASLMPTVQQQLEKVTNKLPPLHGLMIAGLQQLMQRSPNIDRYSIEHRVWHLLVRKFPGHICRVSLAPTELGDSTTVAVVVEFNSPADRDSALEKWPSVFTAG